MTEPKEGSGFGQALAAYLVWGLFPLYFRALAGASPLEILAHRVVWSVVLLIPVILLTGRWPALRRALGSGRMLAALAASALLLGSNWLIFIGAVGRGEVVQASLGYFINPLVSVLLGRIFLGERLRPRQWWCIVLAAAGVLVLALEVGRLPWISLALAFTFGLYGLIRKTATVGALEGLAAETLLGVLPAAAYLVWLGRAGTGSFLAGDLRLDILLPLAGVVTSLPLLSFAVAARRLPLATVGLMQYLTPTLQFLVAVLVFREPFGGAQVAAFAFIWIGLLFFTADALGRLVRRPADTAAP